MTEYDDIRSAVQAHLADEDIAAFESIPTDDLYDRTARLIDVDPTVVRQSIERLLS